MNVELKDNQRFLSGLMFLGIGAIAIYMAQDYPMGSALRMGPGYFPIALGGIMIAFGLFELVIGVLKPARVKGDNWSLRALAILPLATVIFGILMEHTGFVPALVALVYISAWAGPQFKFWEVTLIAIFLTAASVGLFIYALGLPYPLFVGY